MNNSEWRITNGSTEILLGGVSGWEVGCVSPSSLNASITLKVWFDDGYDFIQVKLDANGADEIIKNLRG